MVRPVARRTSPFLLLLALAGGNAILSYVGLPAGWKASLGFAFFAVFLGAQTIGKGNGPEPAERIPPPPGWAPPVLFLLFAILYYFGLTSFAAWPLYDEAVTGLYALDNLEGWDGRLHYYYSALPPLMVWLQAVLFKFMGPGLAALWILPASLALGTLALLAAATRRLEGKTASILVLAAGGSGFWLMEAGRISHPFVLMLFWTALGLYVLSRAVDPGSRRPAAWAAVLGLVLGTGFYTFYAWPFVVVAVLALYGGIFRIRRPGVPGPLAVLSLGIPVLILGVLYARSVWQGAWDGHVLELWGSFASAGSWHERVRYVGSLFWIPDFTFFCGPLWGGILDPLETGLLFLGCAEIVRRRQWALAGWLGGLGLVLMAPGLLSFPPNHTRTIQVFPLLLFLVVRGLIQVMGTSRHPWRLAGGILAVSLVLNLFHLWGPVRTRFTLPSEWGTHRSAEQFRAFPILKRLAMERGPGVLFQRLDSGAHGTLPYNPSLYVLTHPWNILADPGADGATAKWAAIYTDAHHQPYLSRRFRGIEWHSLEGSDAEISTGHALGVFPGSALSGKEWKDWVRAERLLQRLYRETLDLTRLFSAPSFTERVPLWLTAEREFFRRDPFLRTVYMERMLETARTCRNEFPLDRMVSDTRRSPYPSPLILRTWKGSTEAEKRRKEGTGRE